MLGLIELRSSQKQSARGKFLSKTNRARSTVLIISFDAPSLRLVGQSYPSSLDLRFRINMVSKVKLDVSAFRTSQCLDFLLQTQTRSRLRLKSDIPNPSLGENFTHLSICCVTFWARSSVHGNHEQTIGSRLPFVNRDLGGDGNVVSSR